MRSSALKARGYGITRADVDAHLADRRAELTDEELDAAAGGTPSVTVYHPTSIFLVGIA